MRRPPAPLSSSKNEPHTPRPSAVPHEHLQYPRPLPPLPPPKAIGAPISKLSLHTACGGIQPTTTMPVVFDVGTDNEDLLRSPLYVGVRHRRVRGDAYYQVLVLCARVCVGGVFVGECCVCVFVGGSGVCVV